MGLIKRQIGVIASLATKERIPEAAAVALALILALALWLGTRYVAQADLVRHTLEVESKISRIWSHLQDAEIGQRSYVLTGDERFLGPFVGIEPLVNAELADLAQLASDNAEQVVAIAEARPFGCPAPGNRQPNRRLRRQGGYEVARAVVLEGRGHALMQDLRARFQRMLEAEDELLKARTAAATRTISLLSIALVLAIAITGAALGYWIFNARRSAQSLPLRTRRSPPSRSGKRPSSRCGRCRRWRRSGSWPAASRTTSTTCWPSSSAASSLARRRMAARRRGRGFLGRPLDGAHRARRWSAACWPFSRQQPLAPQPLDAEQAPLRHVGADRARSAKSISMETYWAAVCGRPMADPGSSRTPILNLCVNARDAMPEGGRAHRRDGQLPSRRPLLAASSGVPSGQYVLIAVTDTGTGMTTEVAAKAFDPFFTTKEPEGHGSRAVARCSAS